MPAGATRNRACGCGLKYQKISYDRSPLACLSLINWAATGILKATATVSWRFEADMKRMGFLKVFAPSVVLVALAVSPVPGSAQATAHEGHADPSTVAQATFNKDVLPILQKNCQVCHRPGEVAPMSFLTYQDVRPWAKAIEVAVVKRQMPPWFADPAYGHFADDKRLPDADIATLSAWVAGGAVE